MATYEEIQDYVKGKFGRTVKTCWIADVKDSYGLTGRVAWNRAGASRKHPCPARYRQTIEDAMRHFKMI